MKKVFLTALGCRLNEAELQQWAQAYQAKGIALSNQPEQADLIVVNTCAVTGEASRKSRQHIRRQYRLNPQAKLAVTGCYASLETEELESMSDIDLVIDNSEKETLVEQTSELLSIPSMPKIAEVSEDAAIFQRNKERAFIKIQDGCRYRCTFCIVTVARGDERSRSVTELVSEVNQHAASGVQEIVLTGVHVGGYGSDIDSNLFSLVRTILNETDIPRIRFASVEPWDLPEDFFTLFDNPRVMPHMHLPLQSGCNSVLKRMSRRCKTDSFFQLVEQARQQIPNFNVTTDIIVGFPGETDEEFQASCHFIENLGFGHIHIFSYSKREGTKAARLPHHINNSIKKQRSQTLHVLANRLKQDAMQKQVGQNVPVLWEGSSEILSNGLRRYVGHTPNYHRVFLDVEENYCPANQILLTEIQSFCQEATSLQASVDLSLVNQSKSIEVKVV